MMHSDSFSAVGQDIRRLESDKADKHKIHSLEREVGGLRSSLTEAQSDINGFRSQIEHLQNQIAGLMNRET